MKCKYEGSGWAEGRCVGTKEIDPCPGYEKCDRFKSDYKTNADHIRSLSDEELAEFIATTFENGKISVFAIYPELRKNRCGLDWLRQPYKEAADD